MRKGYGSCRLRQFAADFDRLFPEPGRIADKELHRLVGRLWAREKKPLRRDNPKAAQRLELPVGFDTFGDNLGAGFPGKPYQCRGKRPACRVKINAPR